MEIQKTLIIIEMIDIKQTMIITIYIIVINLTMIKIIIYRDNNNNNYKRNIYYNNNHGKQNYLEIGVRIGNNSIHRQNTQNSREIM